MQSGLGNQVGRPGQQRPHRRPQPLGHARHDCGRRVGQFRRWSSQRYGGVEQPGAVQMHRRSQPSSRRKVLSPEGQTARGQMGVLQADQRHRRPKAAAARGHCLSRCRRVNLTAGIVHCVDLEDVVPASSTALIGHQMLPPAHHHVAARRSVQPQSNLIAHCARRHVHRGRLAHQRREPLLQAID